MDYQPLQYIYKSSGREDANTLLLLHGTGGDENDLLPLAQHFAADINVLSLRGNVQEGGMPRFFRRLGMGIFDEKDLEFRSHELVAFVREIAGKEHFDTGKLVALGYSNGANIAGSILALYPDLLAAAILYRPMQPFRDMGSFTSRRHSPVFMSNGALDPTINPEDTERYVALLKDAGYRVSHHNLQAGHQLTQEDLALSVSWYKDNF
jgi:phospholipase/carboxylesterase